MRADRPVSDAAGPSAAPVSGVPEPERLARVTLSCGVEPGDGTTSSLVRQLGAVRALERSLASTSDTGVAEQLAARLSGVDPVRQLDQAARCGIRFVVPGDPEWPASLDDLDRAITADGFGGTPSGLWVKGPTSLTELDASVGVVGSRAASVYGVEMTRAICEHLVEEPRGETRPRDALTRVERQVIEWVPVSEHAEVDSISRLCGLHVRTTEGALRRMKDKGLVLLADDGWRVAPDV